MPESCSFAPSRLADAISRFSDGKVLLVGDIMLDEYLEGDAERISPEAPIPIVRVAESRLLLGGAGNVARNIATLGGKAHLVSICGRDAKGDTLAALLERENITASLQSLTERPTTLKTRVIARNQQMLRIDHEDTAPLAPLITEALLRDVASLIEEYSVLVVSDYGKGAVSRELMEGLRALRDRSASKPRILVDPKTPNFPLYEGVHLLTPNAKETSEGAGLPARNQEEILAAGQAIFTKLGCDHLLTTLGASGMALFLSPETVWHIPTAARKVFDVTGAGDTVIATLALGLASGADLLDSCILANYAAGVVVADIGASTVTAGALESIVRAAQDPGISLWRS